MTLYICGTPIGNLEDATFRLIRILQEVDLIACEDTRHTAKLLQHYNIQKRTISYHQHNRRQREDILIEELKSGKNVALVSDAGMPGISDPGYELIRRAYEENIDVEIIPGPSALVSALVLSGFDTTRFVFEGFLPSRAAARRQRLREMQKEARTIVLYEAPHRLLELLEDMMAEWGNRKAAVIREMTKVHEEVRRGPLPELLKYYQENPARGEITVVVEGASPEPEAVDLDAVVMEVLNLMEQGVQKKEALKMKALQYRIKRGDIYKRLEQTINKNKCGK